QCDISNFTVINGDEKTTRIQVTPQCVLCEKYPKTACGYTMHLFRHHKTTLKWSRIYLVCACGFNHTTQDDYKKHDKKCSGREFTLHKLNQD
ncbi:hypothetical protein PMAYCL1PPCAC_14293, partial [Pristionchus mayeri]